MLLVKSPDERDTKFYIFSLYQIVVFKRLIIRLSSFDNYFSIAWREKSQHCIVQESQRFIQFIIHLSRYTLIQVTRWACQVHNARARRGIVSGPEVAKEVSFELYRPDGQVPGRSKIILCYYFISACVSFRSGGLIQQ